MNWVRGAPPAEPQADGDPGEARLHHWRDGRLVVAPVEQRVDELEDRIEALERSVSPQEDTPELAPKVGDLLQRVELLEAHIRTVGRERDEWQRAAWETDRIAVERISELEGRHPRIDGNGRDLLRNYIRSSGWLGDATDRANEIADQLEEHITYDPEQTDE